MTLTPLLALSDIHLTLGEGEARTHILRGIDLRLQPGERLAVLGPSGSGKSSLLSVAAGLERPQSGEVVVAGEALSGLDEDQLARLRGRRLGIVLQSFQLLPTMTAIDNVAVPLELAGVDAATARDRAADELRAVGMGHRLDHYPAQLSGGEQQRVAIARATAPRPTLLLADEPTGNLDSDTAQDVIALLFERSGAAGAGLLVITHDAALAARADRVVRMLDGRLAA